MEKFRLTATVVSTLAVVGVVLAGCLPAGHEPTGGIDPRDLAPTVDKSGQPAQFWPSHLVADEVFGDAEAVSASGLQAFFESTPYDGARSFLADLEIDDIPYAEVLATLCQTYQINPLVVLATLQKESGIVSKTAKPSDALLNKAFGCGCPDGSDCDPTYKGLKAQTECALSFLAQHRDRVLSHGETVTGWAPGKSKKVLDGFRVLPGNRASAVLYTYTPWVLRNAGGNWLFWNVFTKYALATDYAQGVEIPTNEGFIGGTCDSDDDCFYDGGVCANGLCSKACTSTCPDRSGPGFLTTRCMAQDDGALMCVAPSVPD